MTASRPASGILVRPATPEDAAVLVRFSAAMARETEGRTLDDARLRNGTMAVLARPELGRYLVAEAVDDRRREVVGQLLLTYEWSDWRNATFWWIQSVYVDCRWRRQGIFTTLYRYVSEEARSRPDVCGLRLYVEGTNLTAKRVYERLGMVHAHYEVLEDDFVLSKQARRDAD